MEPISKMKGSQELKNEIHTLEDKALKKSDKISVLKGKKKKLLDDKQALIVKIESQRKIVLKMTEEYNDVIQRREPLFKARKKGIKLPINAEDKEAEDVWDFIDNEKLLDQTEMKIQTITSRINKLEKQFNHDIELLAKKYLKSKSGVTPSKYSPLFIVIGTHMHQSVFEEISAIIEKVNVGDKSQLPRLKNKVAQLDSITKQLDDSTLSKIFTKMIEVAHHPSPETSISNIKEFLELFDVSPNYAAYRLSKIPVGDAAIIRKFLLKELLNLSPVIQACIRYEIQHFAGMYVSGTSLAGELLRGSSVTDMLPGDFQSFCLEPLFTEGLKTIFKTCLSIQSLELNPELADEVEVNQGKIMGNAKLVLLKIKNILEEKNSAINKDLKEIYRLFWKSVSKQLPGRQNQQLASLFFLRFFNVAISSPEHSATPEQARNSVLLAKILQSVAVGEEPHQEWMKFIAEGDPSFIQQQQSTINEIVALLIK